MIPDIGDKSSQTTQTTTTTSNTDGQQFAEAMKTGSVNRSPDSAKNGTANGSPDSAKSGTEAAKDLLSSNNPYFYNPLLFKTDRNYSPNDAKAEAFAATLYDYEQKDDNADIKQLLDTLGPVQAAQLFAEAGNLQGPQVNASSVAFAQNQKGVDQVLSKALLSLGIQLGDGTRPGTLASSLLQQATQSGNNALSMAGILNQAGTSTQIDALKNEFLYRVDGKLGNPTTDSFDRATYAQAALSVINAESTQNASPGIFGSNSADVPQADRTLLREYKDTIDNELADGHEIDIDTMRDIGHYLSGQGPGTNGESHAQLLANLMGVLGPRDSYAVLTALAPADAGRGLEIGGTLKTLASSGAFTANDAKAIALAQANFAPSNTISPVGSEIWESWINALPNDQQGIAVKTAFAQGTVASAQRVGEAIASGKYSGDDLANATSDLNLIAGSATQLSGSLPDQAKLQLFQQLYVAGNGLTGKMAGQETDLLDTYAANVLGSLHDKALIATTLRRLAGADGVGPDGTLSGNLARFIQSALSGQVAIKPDGSVGLPKGVTSLLNGIEGSGDKKLIAGTLDTVLQWSMNNPQQASVLAAQDTGDTATGYRDALTNLLNQSFNQFVALDPVHPGEPTTELQNRTLEDLQVLTTIEMGPPYNGNAAGHFATVFGMHAAQFAAYAAGQGTNHAIDYRALDSLLANPGHSPRNAAADIFGQLIGTFNQAQENFKQSLLYDAESGNTQAGELSDAATTTADLLDGFGLGLTLVGAPEAGAAFLFAGAGTQLVQQLILQPASSQQKAALATQIEHGNLKPTDVLNQLWNAWKTNLNTNSPAIAPAELGYSYGSTLALTNVAFYNDYQPPMS